MSTGLVALSAFLACGDGPGASRDASGTDPDRAGSTTSPGAASSGGTSSGGASSGGASSGGASSGGTTGGTSAAAKLAIKLRGKAQFLVGMGNDLAPNHDQDGAYTLGTTLDLHYAYLVGLKGQGGWPDWNANGTFIDILANSAKAHGVTPMYTLYSMAAWGEGNLSVLTNDGYMKPYWDGAKLLFQRIAAFGDAAVVQFEPDFWGFAQMQSPDAKHDVHVTSLASDCAGLTNDLAGMGRCLLKLARTYAPKAAVGFHVSEWAGSPSAIVSYFKAIGADAADFITTDMLDRDAGCFEAHVDPACQRGGSFYWDESNTTSPNFHEHLAWIKSIGDGVGLPILWWQVPFGVPSATPGGTAGHYRDNRVHYMFSHVDEFVAAGGVGAVFGTGAGNQTYITTDGGQFKDAVTAYFAKPTPIP